MIPTSSAEPIGSDAVSLADGLPGAASAIKCARAPEMSDLGQIAEHASIARYYCLDDLMDTPLSGRAQVYSACGRTSQLSTQGCPQPEPSRKNRPASRKWTFVLYCKLTKRGRGLGKFSVHTKAESEFCDISGGYTLIFYSHKEFGQIKLKIKGRGCYRLGSQNFCMKPR